MNQILADAVRGVNAFVACIIMLAGALVGVAAGHSADGMLLLGVLGLALGFVVAVLVCGTVAVLCQIEHHLHDLVEVHRREGKLPPSRVVQPFVSGAGSRASRALGH